MIDSIQFGSRQIDFMLAYSNRKSLGITVTSNMDVLVKAPLDTPMEKVKEIVRKKAPWIIRQQSFFLSFHPKTPARKFIGGETHLYLGKQYRLKIDNPTDAVLTSGHKNSVKLSSGFIMVFTSDKTKVKFHLENWYRHKAKLKFEEIARPIIEKFILRHKLSFVDFPISIREMPTRWGSCTPKGKIILNPELIKAPKVCIEYVIIHELCHLIYHDHTQKFLDLQSTEMPDWEKWKLKLEKLLA